MVTSLEPKQLINMINSMGHYSSCDVVVAVGTSLCTAAPPLKKIGKERL